MANLENSSRRIIGVRAVSAGPLRFCEARNFSPAVGEWVLVEGESGKFPAQVVLPNNLIEAHRLPDGLPEVVGLAGQAELVAAGVSWAVEAEVVRRFVELSAAPQWPYLLKEVEARPDRLIVRLVAALELKAPDYVPLLEELAKISKTRVELFLVNKDAVPLKPPQAQDEKFAGWVNGLLKALDPVALAKATVGEPLLDESEVYRPSGATVGRAAGRTGGQRPGSEKVEAENPVASYDPARQAFGPLEVE
jgi:hypothetical protein